MLPNPQIFGYEISWYSSFHYIGVIAAYLFGIYYYKNEQHKMENKYLIPLLVLIPFIALFGSRLAGMCEGFVRSGQWTNVSVLFLSPAKGQFRWCGSLLALIIVLPIAQSIFKIKNFYPFFDTLVLSLCLLTIFTKQGCQFSGDGCYGIPTTLPVGMFYPYGAKPNLLPAHPTPIYDSLFHLFLFASLLWFNKRKIFAGQTTLLYFVGASVFYILLEIIRINPETAIGLTIPQICYTGIVVIGLLGFGVQRRKQAEWVVK